MSVNQFWRDGGRVSSIFDLTKKLAALLVAPMGLLVGLDMVA